VYAVVGSPLKPGPHDKHQVFQESHHVGSFSGKSIKTLEESNQSVAQELKTNESIAIQSYAVQQARMQHENGAADLVNSDGVVVEVDKRDHDMPNLAHHQYKKSVVNPTNGFGLDFLK